MRFAFFPLTPASGNLSKEWLMAGTLAAHGANVTIVACDGAQERCVVKISDTDRNNWDRHCAECTLGVRMLHQASFQGSTVRLQDMSRLIDPVKQQAMFQALGRTPDDELLTFTYDGLPFGEWSRASLRIEYYGERWHLLPELPAKAREWLRSTINAHLATVGCIERLQPDCIVIMNAVISSEQAVWKTARQLGVRSVSYEMGLRPSSLLIRESHPVVWLNFTEEQATWQHYPLSAAEDHRLRQYMGRRKISDSRAEYIWSPKATGSPAALMSRLSLDPQKPVVAMFANLTGDTGVFHVNKHFANQTEWLDETLRFAEAHPEMQLVIRAHPVEAALTLKRGHLPDGKIPDRIAGLLAELRPTLPGNVRLVDADEPLSSYDLIELARFVIVYTSTIGMEATDMGKPVVVCGDNHYAPIGFAHAPPSRAGYLPLLERLLADPQQPPGAQERLRRYMYLFYFRGNFYMPNLHFLLQLSEAPVDWDRFMAGHARTMAFAQSSHPEQVHISRYLHGEEPYVIPPPLWRPQEGQAPPLPATAQVLVLPAWESLPTWVEGLLRPAMAWQFPVDFQIAAGNVALDEAIRRLTGALAALGPAEGWPSLDLLPNTLTTEQLGSLLYGVHAVVYDGDAADPVLLGMAQLLGIPCLEGASAETLSELLTLLPASGHAMRLDAIYLE